MCVLTLKSSHRPDGIFTCFALVLAGRWCRCSEWLGDLLVVHHHWQLSYFSACSRSKVPIAPMGRWLTCPNRLSSIRDLYVPATPANFPSPRWDFHMSRALCFQGGGVFVASGTVTFSSCTITGNTAYSVCAHTQNFPSPRWDFHMFSACACRGAVPTSMVAR